MTEDFKVVRFPTTSKLTQWRNMRRNLLSALRSPAQVVILDLSGRTSLNVDDLDLLLTCAAQVSGLDPRLVLVAGSRSNRALLEATRIDSLFTVFTSMDEALTQSKTQFTRQASARLSFDRSA